MQGVSVVIPIYNGAAYLGECVQSVLAQSVSPVEIIVIDDGSEDDTPRVAASLSPQIRYVRQANGGSSAARNSGRALVRTEFVAFLDCDDLWVPQKLEWQLEALSRDVGATMAFGHVKQFVSSELSASDAAALKCDDVSMPGWLGSVILIRNRDFERAGPFDETIRFGEFIEWFSRAKDMGQKSLMLPQVVCHRRLHMNNMGRKSASSRSDYARTLKMILDRRRQQP